MFPMECRRLSPLGPEFIDPVFARKKSPQRPFLMTENERFWACLRENWVYTVEISL